MKFFYLCLMANSRDGCNQKEPDCPVRSRDSKLKPRISSDCSILTLASLLVGRPRRRGEVLASRPVDHSLTRAEPDLRIWRVAAGIPFRVRPAALAEPDLVRYTIRLPAGVIHRGFRPLCETNQLSCHGHSPLSVGPCFSNSFSPADTPSLRPHYQTSSLLWVSPTSDRLRPLPRCLGLSEGAHSRVRRLTDLPGYHAFSMWGSTRPQIPGCPLTLALARQRLLPAGCENPSARSNDAVFGTPRLQGQHHLLPLHLASFRTYASSALLPGRLQGSIPGLWLSVTWVGLSPTRIRGLARPQPRIRLSDKTSRLHPRLGEK